MLVVVNSDYRTGSTWVYNIIREIFVVRNLEFESYGGSVENIRDNILTDKNIIIKCHNYHDFRYHDNLKILYTVRNYIDKRGSSLRYGEFKSTSHSESIVNEVYYQKLANAFVISYDRYYYDPLYLIQHINHFIFNDQLDRNSLQEIDDNTSIVAMKKISNRIESLQEADPITEIRGSHILNPKPGAYYENN